MVYCTCIIITKYSCVFLKLGESIYVAMDLIPILLGSLPLAHNAQHSLVIFFGGGGVGVCSQHSLVAMGVLGMPNWASGSEPT